MVGVRSGLAKGKHKHKRVHPAHIYSLIHCLLLSPSDHGVIHSDRVFAAMLATDRGVYSRDYPYADSPQSIGIIYKYINIQAYQCGEVSSYFIVLLKVKVTDVCHDYVLWCFVSQVTEQPSVHHTWWVPSGVSNTVLQLENIHSYTCTSFTEYFLDSMPMLWSC